METRKETQHDPIMSRQAPPYSYSLGSLKWTYGTFYFNISNLVLHYPFSTILNVKGRIQIIRSLCTLIEEREDADDEETEQEVQSQERPEDAVDFKILRLCHEADIECGHYGAYQG